MARLAAAVAAADEAPFEHAIALIRPFIEESGWFDRLLADEVARMAANPLHLPAMRASRKGAARHLVLARTERIWITATIIDPGEPLPARIHFSGRMLLCRGLAGDVEGELYRLEQGRAVSAGRRRWRDGAIIALDERREALCLDALDRPLSFLRAQVAAPGPVAARIHDRASGAPIATAQADESHARALMLLSLLRLQERRDAVPAFAAALDAPLPEQRWAVMREYLALDTAVALPALRLMARDESDAPVLALAARTLAQIGAAPCPA